MSPYYFPGRITGNEQLFYLTDPFRHLIREESTGHLSTSYLSNLVETKAVAIQCVYTEQNYSYVTSIMK